MINFFYKIASEEEDEPRTKTQQKIKNKKDKE